MSNETKSLEELAQPVAWEVKGILCHSQEEAQAYVGTPESLYSQEYVSALQQCYERLDAMLTESVEALKASEQTLEREREKSRRVMSENQQQAQRIAELEAIKTAAEKLVRCKGRYHSEQNYRALAALFGVTTPDLPPVEGDA